MNSPDDSYCFATQLKKGEDAERCLDRHFGKFYFIENVGEQAQRWGIDRIWWTRAMTDRRSVQYKADWTASRTGNVFIETVSVDSQNVAGWAYTSVAQLLVYYLPNSAIAYVAPMLAIRDAVKEWAQARQEKTIPNGSYNTRGLPIPLEEFAERCLAQKFRIDS